MGVRHLVFIGRKTYSQSQQKCHSLWKQRSRPDIKLLTNFPLQLAGYSCKNHDQRKFRLQCIQYGIHLLSKSTKMSYLFEDAFSSRNRIFNKFPMVKWQFCKIKISHYNIMRYIYTNCIKLFYILVLVQLCHLLW